MKTLLIVLSIMMISLVLLQSAKAESAGQVFTGGSDNLFANRKERGGELFVSRLTLVTGVAFFVVAILNVL